MKYLILGGGPTGLTIGCKLKKAGIDDFLILEKESEAGGLCRSEDVDGSPFDIGGGHFLDVRKQDVNTFLYQFMPREEWDEYSRDSRIFIHDIYINSPIEANIWQMKTEDQVEYLKSIAIAGCNLDVPKPVKFTNWILWKLGKKVSEDYMLPYNRKMFGEDLDSLGTYWLEKLPDVSFEETLLSCLNKEPYGKQPAHAHFLYPKKYGYGEVWRRMAEYLGDNIKYNTAVETIDLDAKIVNNEYSADMIINTAPWDSFKEIKGLTEELTAEIGELKHTGVVTEYIAEKLDTPAHWIYYPDEELSYHRILVRHNFCPGSKGYWTETRKERYVHKEGETAFLNEYAYPLNTLKKPEIMSKLLSFTEEKNVFGVGRWGEWQHYNSDVVVEKAMAFADKIIG
ncbi:MAG: FAD-dependent oxidoreductase [Lachnospiraceae bacterium]|nr:FAD-dependent oxidoreductase [Lachnospiraceae bacterium]